MKFQCPNKMSLGMKTALAWHQEQLLLARKRWDLKNRRRVATGHIPSSPPTLISHLVHNAENLETTVTSTTHQSPSPSPSSLSPSQNPFAPSAWRHLASTVRKPRRWQVDLPLPSDKVVKIPLQFRRPIPSKSTLPKGWVYVAEDAAGGVKDELTDPSLTTASTRYSLAPNASVSAHSRPIPIAAIAGLRVQPRGCLHPLQHPQRTRSGNTSPVRQGTPRGPKPFRRGPNEHAGTSLPG
jgi:hypothetical protein